MGWNIIRACWCVFAMGGGATVEGSSERRVQVNNGLKFKLDSSACAKAQDDVLRVRTSYPALERDHQTGMVNCIKKHCVTWEQLCWSLEFAVLFH